MKIKAKFKSKCGVCGKEWQEGSEIHYSKEYKTACVDEVCLNKRIPQQPKPGKTNIRVIEIKAEDQTLIDQENRYYYLAFLIAQERYPDVDQDSDKFGQITNAICNRIVKLKSDLK